MDDFIPTLSHARERDIDLLLVEELHASYDFTRWVVNRVGIDTAIASWDVKHSKRRTRSRREIDIFVEFGDKLGMKYAVLIENKLDTTEQPDQAESYREELAILGAAYGQSAMIIVCPKAYRTRYATFVDKFDAVIEYEELAVYFRETAREVGAELVLRYEFRAALLDQAIFKQRRGYVAIPDVTVGDFNSHYVALLAKIAPEIVPGPSMLKLANPRESTSMIFDQAASLSNLSLEVRPRRFAHELGRGSDRRANYVAVTFAGWGHALPSIESQLQNDSRELGAFFEAKKPTKVRPTPGLVMALPAEPVDNQSDFDGQREAIERGIATARMLRSWLLSNETTLLRWKALVDRAPG